MQGAEDRINVNDLVRIPMATQQIGHDDILLFCESVHGDEDEEYRRLQV